MQALQAALINCKDGCSSSFPSSELFIAGLEEGSWRGLQWLYNFSLTSSSHYPNPSSRSLTQTIYETYSWEIFDQTFICAYDEEWMQNEEQSKVIHITLCLLCDQVKAKEWSIMIADKLFQCHTPQTWTLILYAVQLHLVRVCEEEPHILHKCKPIPSHSISFHPIPPLTKMLACLSDSSNTHTRSPSAPIRQRRKCSHQVGGYHHSHRHHSLNLSRSSCVGGRSRVWSLSIGQQEFTSSSLHCTIGSKELGLWLGFLTRVINLFLQASSTMMEQLPAALLEDYLLVPATKLVIMILGGDVTSLVLHLKREKFRRYMVTKHNYRQSSFTNNTSSSSSSDHHPSLSSYLPRGILSELRSSSNDTTRNTYEMFFPWSLLSDEVSIEMEDSKQVDDDVIKWIRYDFSLARVNSSNISSTMSFTDSQSIPMCAALSWDITVIALLISRISLNTGDHVVSVWSSSFLSEMNYISAIVMFAQKQSSSYMRNAASKAFISVDGLDIAWKGIYLSSLAELDFIKQIDCHDLMQRSALYEAFRQFLCRAFTQDVSKLLLLHHLQDKIGRHVKGLVVDVMRTCCQEAVMRSSTWSSTLPIEQLSAIMKQLLQEGESSSLLTRREAEESICYQDVKLNQTALMISLLNRASNSTRSSRYEENILNTSLTFHHLMVGLEALLLYYEKYPSANYAVERTSLDQTTAEWLFIRHFYSLNHLEDVHEEEVKVHRKCLGNVHVSLCSLQETIRLALTISTNNPQLTLLEMSLINVIQKLKKAHCYLQSLVN
eukprot:scaffold423_cov185-Ochromonas_danica.AAC.11